MYWLKDKTGREFYETWENDIWIRKQIFYRKFVLSSASHKADQPNTHRRNHNFVAENDAFSTNYLCKLQNRLKIKIT